MKAFLTMLALACLSSTAFAQQLDLSLSTAVVTFP